MAKRAPAKKQTKKEAKQEAELFLAPDLEGLEPHVLAYALVGRFLNTWAFMESALNEAIAIALDLKLLQGIIVTAEIDFLKKIFMVRTAVKLELFEKQAKEYETLLNGIQKLSEDRNIIAHNFFSMFPEEKAVKFYHYKARGKLDISTPTYTISKLESMDAELHDAQRKLSKLGDEFKKRRSVSTVPGLFQSSYQVSGLGTLGLLGLPPLK